MPRSLRFLLILLLLLPVASALALAQSGSVRVMLLGRDSIGFQAAIAPDGSAYAGDGRSPRPAGRVRQLTPATGEGRLELPSGESVPFIRLDRLPAYEQELSEAVWELVGAAAGDANASAPDARDAGERVGRAANGIAEALAAGGAGIPEAARPHLVEALIQVQGLLADTLSAPPTEAAELERRAAAGIQQVLAALHPLASGHMTINPKKVDFGTVAYGDRVLRDITIVNDQGTSSVVGITSRGFGSATPFLKTTEDQAYPIEQGEKRTVTVGLAPIPKNGHGPFEAEVDIHPRDEDHTVVKVTGRAVEPLKFTPAGPIDFGKVDVLAKESASVQISNRSRVTQRVMLIGPRSAPFDVDLPLREGFSIAPGRAVTVTVTFNPTRVQRYDGELEVQSERQGESGDSPLTRNYSVKLRGEGRQTDVGVEPLGRLSIIAEVGKEQRKPMVLTNHSERRIKLKLDLTELPRVFSTPRAQREFQITLAPKGEAAAVFRLPITFTPERGDVNAEGKIRIRGPGLPGGEREFVEEVRGVGQGAPFYVKPYPIDFGELRVGQTITKDVTVENVLKRSLELQLSVLSDSPSPPFRLVSPAELDLEPEGKVTVKIEFAPQSAAVREPEATLLIRSPSLDVPNHPYENRTRVQGKVTSNVAFTVDPSPLAFGAVHPQRPEQRTLTIRNVTNQPIPIVFREGGLATAQNGIFRVVKFLSSNQLPANGSDTVVLEYTPVRPAPSKASVEFQSGESLVKVEVTGEGVPLPLQLQITPDPLVIQQTQAGYATGTVTVKNQTDAQLRLIPRIEGQGFTPVVPGSGVLIPANGSAEITIRFNYDSTAAEAKLVVAAVVEGAVEYSRDPNGEPLEFRSTVKGMPP